MNLIFDCETDGLYDDVSCIHCLVTKDLETGQLIRYNDQGNSPSITTGVTMLMEAETVIGHNIIGYDIPVLKKIYPFFTPPEAVDTLILSRLIHGNILDVDRKKNWRNMPLQLFGRHSLESYGYRLGEYKGSFGKTSDWKEWSQEMEDYCAQDVEVTYKLWHHFLKKFTSQSQPALSTK